MGTEDGGVEEVGLLTLHRGGESFDDLGGLRCLKGFCVNALEGSRRGSVRARGVLLLGVPGVGKSAFAKALGNQTGRPTLVLDVGSLMGSLVGQTEERTQAGAQDRRRDGTLHPVHRRNREGAQRQPVVGADRFSGVSARLLGTLLSWLNDHESDVFVVATANDVSKLPPELTRAERFDGDFLP